MKKAVVFILLICFFMPSETMASMGEDKTYIAVMKRDILCLMAAYPEYIADLEQKTDGSVYLVMKSGRKLIYDDKRVKSYGEKLFNPDLQDTLEQIYPLSTIKSLMEDNYDPGRFRVYALLSEVYGASRENIEKRLSVLSGCHGLRFNSCNKASESFSAAMKELTPLANADKSIGSCVYPFGGTYNYRLIAGTNQLSPHSFGIAVDLAVNKKDYWKWAAKSDGNKRLGVYPEEIVKIFEKNNFIWGGKWGHFDIMHYEYRPEIIFKARYFSNKPDSSMPWYEGVPMDNMLIQNAVGKINDEIK